jgi:hypothetical protein
VLRPVSCREFVAFNASLVDGGIDEWNDTLGWFTSAMHAILSSLTAVLLLVHAAFGCCWHHAHRCTEHGNVLAAAEPAGCCQHHGHEGSKPEPRPCDCKLECGGSCVYLLPQKIRIEAPRSVVSLDLVAAALVLAEAQIVSAGESDVGRSSHGAAPPLRLHLMHQLLLN